MLAPSQKLCGQPPLLELRLGTRRNHLEGLGRARIESTHVADGGLLVDLGLEILEDALVDHFGGGIWYWEGCIVVRLWEVWDVVGSAC